MAMGLFLLVNLFIVGLGNEAVGHSHCTEYREILQKYQVLLSDYETCITKSGEQTAQIRTFQNTITSGLQSQIDGLRRDQRWAQHTSLSPNLTVPMAI